MAPGWKMPEQLPAYKKIAYIINIGILVSIIFILIFIHALTSPDNQIISRIFSTIFGIGVAILALSGIYAASRLHNEGPVYV